MKIQEIRSATLIITYNHVRFLVDPWFAKKDSMPGFAKAFNEHLRQSRTELPLPIEKLVDVDAVIVTYLLTYTPITLIKLLWRH